MTEHTELLLHAYRRERGGDREGAEALALAVLDEAPHHPMALHLAGALALRGGRSRAAVDLLRRARALRPDNADTLLALADALAASGEHAAAIGRYRELLARQPGRPEALVNMARALCRIGQPA